MNVSGLSIDQSYTLQSTTNLALPVWSAETNFVATQSAATFANSTTNCAQKFYRIMTN